MSLDHYVPQVHLRNFYASELGNRLYAIRKYDHKSFQPDSSSICRIEEGNTNPRLQEPRAIEEFLKQIEPKYNTAVSLISRGEPNAHSVFAIAGYMAFILTCSPAANRLGSEHLKELLDHLAKKMDEKNQFTPPPPSLGATNITELLEQGRIQISVDPKYPQALGISQIWSFTSAFGNSHWELLINDYPDSPFFTSDFPTAVEFSQTQILRVFPLRPNLAVRVFPYQEFGKDKHELDFPNFSLSIRKPSRKEISRINQKIVYSAEELVLFSSDLPWIPKFVAKNSDMRLINRTHRIPKGSGTLLLTSLAYVSQSAA
jgi:hypothetical protein